MGYSLHNLKIVLREREAQRLSYPLSGVPAGFAPQYSVGEEAERQKRGVFKVHNVETRAAVVGVIGKHEVFVIEVGVAEDEFFLERDLGWRAGHVVVCQLCNL